MKKLQIFTLCAAIIIGCVLLANAKDLTMPKNLINENLNLGHWTSVSGMTTWASTTGVMSWAYEFGEETTLWVSCDLNEDREINIADINRFYTNCSVINWRDRAKCDLNGDNEFNIADINQFNYKCLNEILKGHDKCDYDADWKVTQSDMTSLMELCTTAILEWNTNLLSVCDFYPDWKLNISDITEIQSVCSKKISWTETGSWAYDTWWDLPNDNICDFNNDREINIADVDWFYTNCSVINWRDSNKCDLNGDNEFNISDINHFNNKCLNEILKWHDKCDYDADWKVTIADMTSLIDICTKAILEWNTNLSPICDFYSDWKLNISDITEIQSICSDKILWRETGSWENNTNNDICDFNNDMEVNIADVDRFNVHCSVINWRDSNKCDLNGDREFNIADINKFNYECYNEIMWSSTDNGSNYSWWNLHSILDNWYSKEKNDAYNFAYNNWLTTMNSIEKANMKGQINRIAFAKMISNFAINVLWQTPDTSKNCNFWDVSSALNIQYDEWVTKACQLWLMWQWIKNFRPNDTVTRAEFGKALSRVLNWDTYNDLNWKYYEKHLKSLNRLWIMNNISNPTSKTTRGDAILMFYRASMLQ